MQPPSCSRCGVTMEPGFLLDRSRQISVPGQWVSGEPARSIWFGVKTGGRKRITIAAHRCPRCGLLELHAPED
jgi:ribosomal protein S27AE